MGIYKCIGVRFRRVGRIYYFKKDNFDLHKNDKVVVETTRGVEYGNVILDNIDINEEQLKAPLKSIIRIATKEDEKKYLDNKSKEKETFQICKDAIKKFNLPMKLLDCEYTLDKNKVLFYYSADNRIDFRELVKDLASKFKIRIEMRQVGVRDETKVLGGIGPCGREFCCSTYLSNFAPISIKYVKEQNVSLNPTKISGCCGRLMCCLNNEEEAYELLNKNLPNVGDSVKAIDGLSGTVVSINTLKQEVRVLVSLNKNDDKEIRTYNAKDLKFKKRVMINTNEVYNDELKDLIHFEKEESESKF